jgi:hypothetical protein
VLTTARRKKRRGAAVEAELGLALSLESPASSQQRRTAEEHGSGATVGCCGSLHTLGIGRGRSGAAAGGERGRTAEGRRGARAHAREVNHRRQRGWRRTSAGAAAAKIRVRKKRVTANEYDR